jgi:hypothetical protein
VLPLSSTPVAYKFGIWTWAIAVELSKTSDDAIPAVTPDSVSKYLGMNEDIENSQDE